MLDEAGAQLFAENTGMPAALDAARDRQKFLAMENQSLFQSNGVEPGSLKKNGESINETLKVLQALEEENERFLADRMELKELLDQILLLRDQQNEDLKAQVVWALHAEDFFSQTACAIFVRLAMFSSSILCKLRIVCRST